MPLNSSKREAIEFRRMKVAQKRIQSGFTQREIATYLGVSVGTVNRDLKALDMQWRKKADTDVEGHRAGQLAEISQMKRLAWLDIMKPGRMGALLQAIKLEAQLTGTISAPSYTFNFSLFQQFLQSKLESGATVGDAFEEWFKSMAGQKQQEGVRLEAHDHQHD